MYADKARRTVDPRSATIALVLNGAALAALIFAAPEVLRPPAEPPLTTTNIPIDPPPEPLPPPKPLDHAKADPRPAPQPSPIVASTPRADVGPVEITPIPATTSDGDGMATGTATATPTPTPLPALIDATFDPRYARDLQPDYPGEETRAQHEGRVVVRVLIGIDGRVKKVERTSATSDAFYRATERQALAHWRFHPAMRGGVPEEEWRTMAIRFVLQGN